MYCRGRTHGRPSWRQDTYVSNNIEYINLRVGSSFEERVAENCDPYIIKKFIIEL